MVFVTPVYAAGEAPVEGVDAQALVEGLITRGHRSAATVPDAAALAKVLAETLQPGDQVICLGAGDITKWAAGLASTIAAQRVEVTA
jgi:UDP-N-acetylmuramate--alanine ligase